MCYESSQEESLESPADRLSTQTLFFELDALMAEPANDDVPAAPAPVVSDVTPEARREALRPTLDEG
ncbi:hypothetical protein PUR29_37085, partial [Methylobacterium ajmalii]